MQRVEISAAGVQLIFAMPPRGAPLLLHWGAPIPIGDAPDPPPFPPPASPDEASTPSVFPTEGFGFFGAPALEAVGRHGHLFDFTLRSHSRDGSRAVFHLQDDLAGVDVTLDFSLDPTSGVLLARSKVANAGDSPMDVRCLAALAVELPDWVAATDLTYGAWSAEGHQARVPLEAGRVERTGRSGRPGFDGGPFLSVCEADAGEQRGRVLAFHLAWSGDYSLFAERLGEGRVRAGVEPRLAPGEVVLAPGEVVSTPEAMAAFSDRGFSGVSERFHSLARARAPALRRHRPVQLNSWEAAYFDVGEARAMALAEAAAELGAERFVLDDGWFSGRDGPYAGLGDWTPDPSKYPRGLGPLIERVRSLGMEFGLWIEPEMISEASTLFRRHPDWILSAPGRPRPTGRNQFVLDLTRAEVRESLFVAIDKLLRDHPISYLKWDCNRDLFPAASAGAPASRRQIEGVYELAARLRAAHPSVSIEACASGGGRMDFGILAYCDRFWPSDATDAIERVRIERRASLFFAPELLGSHVGASPNAWTGRRIDMAFRCLVALFGHFGVELDPATLDARDRDVLKAAIRLYKSERAILIDAKRMRLSTSVPGLCADLALRPDGCGGLIRALRTEERRRPWTPRIRICGLAPELRFEISEIDMTGGLSERKVGLLTGISLAEIGLDADPLHAGAGRLFRIKAI